MDRLENLIQQKMNSSQWSQEIAHRVISKKTETDRRNRSIILSVSGILLIVLCSGIFYKSRYNSLSSEILTASITQTLSLNYEDSFISKDIDEFVMSWD